MPNYQDKKGIPSISKTFSTLANDRKYIFGVLAQFLNVGAMVMCWTYIYQYSEGKGINSVTAANFQFFAFYYYYLLPM